MEIKNSADLSPKDFKYFILPGNPKANFSHRELYNKVYSYWRQTWGQIFTEYGRPDALVADDFMRQEMIPVILYGDDIVVTHSYTLFHLDNKSIEQHRYFSIYSPELIEGLRERNTRNVMSMEFLAASPNWRKSVVQVSMGTVISALGFNILNSLNLDAAITAARKKTKADEISLSFGGVCLKSNVTRGNLDCDLMAFFKNEIKRPADAKVCNYVDYLWENRVDLTGLTTAHPSEIKKAA